MASLTRLARIVAVGLRFGLHEYVPKYSRNWLLHLLARRTHEPRGQRLREALETLGPIFVKFGQVLSTRRDLLPVDIADELARLQDRVPPFSPALAVAEIERSLGTSVERLFAGFERTPVASASIAQVHLAVLHDGREVAVKVLRPGVEAAVARLLEEHGTPVVGGDVDPHPLPERRTRWRVHLAELPRAASRRRDAAPSPAAGDLRGGAARPDGSAAPGGHDLRGAGAARLAAAARRCRGRADGGMDSATSAARPLEVPRRRLRRHAA